MGVRYFFSNTGDYLGGFDEGSMALVPSDAIEVLNPPDNGLDKLTNGQVVAYIPPVSPLDNLTQQVKNLPVDKRCDPPWGLFVTQCLLAIQHTDMEALGHLLNGYSTTDSDYVDIINSAKQLFGL